MYQPIFILFWANKNSIAISKTVFSLLVLNILIMMILINRPSENPSTPKIRLIENFWPQDFLENLVVDSSLECLDSPEENNNNSNDFLEIAPVSGKT